MEIMGKGSCKTIVSAFVKTYIVVESSSGQKRNVEYSSLSCCPVKGRGLHEYPKLCTAGRNNIFKRIEITGFFFYGRT